MDFGNSLKVDDVSSATSLAREVGQARRLLEYTKGSDQHYSGKDYPGGYHTLEIGGHSLPGQRDPIKRFAVTEYDFTGKRVLDIGTNQGGMLHALNGRLKWGVGIDFDHRLVNAASKVAKIRQDDTLSFYVFNLETEPLEVILDLMPEPEADVVFLLAVCKWIKNWRDVIRFSAKVAPEMFFEANGKSSAKSEQVEYLRSTFREVTLLASTSDDDPGKISRQPYWCRGPKADVE